MKVHYDKTLNLWFMKHDTAVVCVGNTEREATIALAWEFYYQKDEHGRTIQTPLTPTYTEVFDRFDSRDYPKIEIHDKNNELTHYASGWWEYELDNDPCHPDHVGHCRFMLTVSLTEDAVEHFSTWIHLHTLLA